jgi:hypothetical protein
MYGELARDKISKIELKKFLAQTSKYLDDCVKFLRREDPEKVVKSFAKHFSNALLNGYRDGTISKESVDSARQIAVLYPSEGSQKMYEMHKKLYEMAVYLDSNKNGT